MANNRLTPEEVIEKFSINEVNTNCLQDRVCPACGNRTRFHITGTATFLVCDDGTDGHTDVEWDDESNCSCLACSHIATLEDFTVEGLDALLADRAGNALTADPVKDALKTE